MAYAHGSSAWLSSLVMYMSCSVERCFHPPRCRDSGCCSPSQCDRMCSDLLNLAATHGPAASCCETHWRFRSVCVRIKHACQTDSGFFFSQLPSSLTGESDSQAAGGTQVALHSPEFVHSQQLESTYGTKCSAGCLSNYFCEISVEKCTFQNNLKVPQQHTAVS